jgi:succinoglycan biosynthesis transport protein ExoP
MSVETAKEGLDSGEMPRQSAVTLRDLVIVAFHYRKIVGAIMAASVVLALLAALFSPVHFTAELEMVLLPGSATGNPLGLALGGGLPSDVSRDANTVAESLRDRALLTKVAQAVGPARINPRLGSRRWLGLLPPIEASEQDNSAVDILERSLKVTAPSDSNILRIAFTHSDRDTAILVADTLADLYLQQRGALYANLRSPFLKEKAQSYAKQLDGIEEEIRQEKERSHILDLNQEILLALNQVDSGVQRQQNERIRRAGLAAEIGATKQRLAAVPPQVFDFQEKSDKGVSDDVESQLTKLYVERERLAQLYQDDDFRVIDVKRQIASLEAQRDRPHRQSSNDRVVRNPSADFLNNHLLQTQVEIFAADKSIEELDSQIKAAQHRVEELRNAEKKLHALERSRLVTDALYRELTQKAEAAQSEEAAAALKSANIRILSNADASLKGESNGVNLALAIFAAGFLVSFGTALVFDWNRQVMLLPHEVERALGMPVLATFNEGEDFARSGIPASVILLAGQLIFQTEKDRSLRKLQVVSQGRQEYRHEFALVLAMELATGQNLRTLLLDLTDEGETQWRWFQEPPPTRTFPGFVSVATTSVDKLDVSVNASIGWVNWQRANKEMLDGFFAELAKHYDMVVIDAPPARDSIVAIRLAKVVDGSMLVVRAEHTRRSVVEFLMSQLLGAGGDMYGAILTGRKLSIPRWIYRWL